MPQFIWQLSKILVILSIGIEWSAPTTLFLTAAAIFVTVSHTPHQVNTNYNACNNGYGEKKKPRHIKLRKHGLKNRRTNVVRLLPNGFQERKLRRLAGASAKLFNEVNYERRQEFFREGRVDLKGTHEVLWEV